MTREFPGRTSQRKLEDDLGGKLASPFRNPVIEVPEVVEVSRPKGSLTPRQMVERKRAARLASTARTDAAGTRLLPD